MKLIISILLQLLFTYSAFGAAGDAPPGIPRMLITKSMIPVYEAEVGFVDCDLAAVENRNITQNNIISIYEETLKNLRTLIAEAKHSKNEYAVNRLNKERLEVQINRTKITSEMWKQGVVCELKIHGIITPTGN